MSRAAGWLSALGEGARSLAAHPLRSALTTSSVAFGAAVLFVLLSYATGVPEATASILRSLGGKEFLVEPSRSRGPGGSRSGRRIRIRYVDMPAIRAACPSIDGMAAAYRPGFGAPAFAKDRSWPFAQLLGVGFDYREVTDMRIVEGRWFTKEEELAGAEVALVSLPLAEGMWDGRSPIGETIDAWQRRFEVIGVYESSSAFAYSLQVPYPCAMEMGDTGGRYLTHLAFAPRRPDLAERAVEEIRSALGALYSFDPRDSRAIDVKENIAFAERVEATSFALQVLVVTIAAVALVLACLGAANVVGIAVAERSSELGLRRALGATAGRIRLEVLAETLLASLSGGVLGVALGWLAARWLGPLEFTDEARLSPRIDGELFLLAIPLLLLTATLAGLPAAARAARTEPATLLRSE